MIVLKILTKIHWCVISQNLTILKNYELKIHVYIFKSWIPFFCVLWYGVKKSIDNLELIKYGWWHILVWDCHYMYMNSLIKLEKKYAPALDNYGQSCFVRSNLFCMMFIHIKWRSACPQDFDFHQIFDNDRQLDLVNFL
jgi:hypothetical protein